MKSGRAESASIGDYIARLILSAPQIAVHFTNGGKTVYRSGGNGVLRDSLLSVYGVNTDSMLCPVHFDDGYLKIEGFVGTPELARANRSGQTITLNGRIIRSNALSNAISRAFDTRVMGGKFPFAVLALSLSFQEVDVNVHPAKLEVRFADEQRIARSIVVSCSEAFTRSYIPSFAAPVESSPEPEDSPILQRFEQTPQLSEFARMTQIDLRTPAPMPEVTLRENTGSYSPPPRVPLYRFPQGRTARCSANAEFHLFKT